MLVCVGVRVCMWHGCCVDGKVNNKTNECPVDFLISPALSLLCAQQRKKNPANEIIRQNGSRYGTYLMYSAELYFGDERHIDCMRYVCVTHFGSKRGHHFRFRRKRSVATGVRNQYAVNKRKWFCSYAIESCREAKTIRKQRQRWHTPSNSWNRGHKRRVDGR